MEGCNFPDLGKFNIFPPPSWEMASSDDEFLSTIDISALDTLVTGSIAMETGQLEENLREPAIENLPPPETPTPSETQTSVKRFKHAPQEELDRLFEARQAPATKKNTMWGMKIFQAWNKEKTGREINMNDISADELNEILSQFYVEARPESRVQKPESDGDEVYHRNTLINLRAAINRYLADLNKNIDIVRDKEFKKSNGILDGLLKERTRTGQSKPTKYKQITEQTDLVKIGSYLSKAATSPIILRQCVWYNLSINFVSRGMEFHHQLQINSFEFHTDDSGEYVTIKHDTQQKNHQGGLAPVQDMSEKRMYAADSENSMYCSVYMLKLLIDKTDKSATSLFNQYNKDCLASPANYEMWFTAKPLAKRSFSRFLSDICTSSNVENKYTPHCLRATAIQHLNDSGYEARHIMLMSNHKSESSLRSYNRNMSTSQKKSLSKSLSTLTTQPATSTQPCLAIENRPSTTVSSTSVIPNAQVSVPNYSQQTFHASNTFTPNFFANSNFSTCTFNFYN